MIIVADSNGAGKSTYYTVNNRSSEDDNIFFESKHINADEILRSSGGDWKNDTDNMKAMRQELTEIRTAIKNKQSFDFETTLAANKKMYSNFVDKAKEQGFITELIYVGIKSPELAKTRIREIEK